MTDKPRIRGGSGELKHPPRCHRTGKRSYACRAEAEHFGRELKQRAYLCGECELWHLTTQQKFGIAADGGKEGEKC
jgi:hypothetical protein